MFRSWVVMALVAVLGAWTGGADAPDSIRQWRSDYLRSIRNRLVQIDRELRRLVSDSLAMDTSANIQYHQILEKARTARDHVDNIKDDMSAVRGDIPSQPWDTLQARMTLSLDKLERLYLSADSANREQKQRERRVRQGRDQGGRPGGQDAGGQEAGGQKARGGGGEGASEGG